MASITITIPDEVKDRVLDAIANGKGWPEQVTDGDGNLVDNPETKAAFAKRMVIEYVKTIVKSEEGHIDAVAARLAAETKVDNEVNIT